jgi:hypothetical protein
MLYILAYLAGALTFGLLTMAVLMRVHRAPPTTLHHRRRNRDARGRVEYGQLMDEEEAAFARKLEAGYQPFPEQPQWERERNGGVDYKWINLTGEER